MKHLFTALVLALASPAAAQSPTLPAGSIVPPGMVLVKDLNFGAGAGNNVNTFDKLDAAVNYHYSQWNKTIDNGGAYGCQIAARTEATKRVGTPTQLVDPSLRALTTDSLYLQAYQKPGVTGTVGPAMAHNCLQSGFELKYTLPAGGHYLGSSIVWETRWKAYNSPNGFWDAIWVAGTNWQGGPEFDVMESFGNQWNQGGNTWGWHSDQIPNTFPQSPTACVNDWPGCLNPWKALGGVGNYQVWHVWTWVYRVDDTWTLYTDGKYFASGKLVWSNVSGPTDMHFMFDVSMFNTQVDYLNTTTTPTSYLPRHVELDYTRIWKN